MIKDSFEHFIIFQSQKLLKRSSDKLAVIEVQIQFSVEKDIVVEMVGKILVAVLEVVY